VKSIAPSGGFAEGGANCAAARSTASVAMQNASPIGSAARSFVMYITVGVTGP
jgi:hypothetical protein